MDWQNILGIAAVIVAVGAVAGLGLLRDRLSVLKDSNEDLRARVSDLESERDRDKAEKTDMQAKITRLLDHEQYLQSVVRDRANYETISTQVEDVHRIVVQIAGHVVPTQEG